MAALYDELGHSEQTPPEAPENPAAHLQAVLMLTPTAPSVPALAGQALHEAALVAPRIVWKVFAGQSVHAAGPVLVLYVPASHFTHTPSERV